MVQTVSFDIVYPLQTLKPISSQLRSRVQNEFAQDDRQVRLHAIYKNGSAVKNLSKHHGIADSQMQISGACFLDLSATDYVEHYVYQNAGDAINVIGGATTTYFGGFKVS